MKHLFSLSLLLLAFLLPVTATAHDFYFNGIYYNIVNDNEVYVTYKGTSYDTYSNEYSGSVTIPETVTYGGTTYSVTSIGNYAFYCCDGLTSITIGNSVNSIGHGAFTGCTGLTSVSIPNSVTTIGNSAFSNCSGLTSIDIPNSVTIIKGSAFENCTSLTSVTIPNSVISIETGAFRSCRVLSSIDIPNSVNYIGEQVFNNCINLISINVETGNIIYDSRNNCNAIIETATNTLIVGCQNTTIPNSVTSIGSSAFRGCTELTNIDIPNSVTSIGYLAFSNCSNLINIIIPNSVTSIGNNAFDGTPWYNNQPDGLLYINQLAFKFKGTMPSGTSITLRDGTIGIADGVFSSCSGLTSITIPNSVTFIGDEAFSGCSGLTSIDIPNSVLTIGSCAFYYCTGLTSIDIPNSVTNLGDGTFFDCFALSNVTIGNSVTSIGIMAFESCENLTNITIGNSVTSIGDWAFEYCSSLTSINIPNSVTSIGDHAFRYCTGLTSIQVANDNPNYDSRDNCNAIIETASNTLILGCMNTVIPNSVITIGSGAFYDCLYLTSITIPNSVTSIGDGAFGGCWQLFEIYCWALVPPTLFSKSFDWYYPILYVYDIAMEAYQAADYWKDFNEIVEIPYTFEVDGTSYHATTMNSASVMANNNQATLYSGDVVIPDSVTYEGMTFAVTGIESNAFDGCFELTSVVIPNSVTSIGEQAFQGCTGLTSVTIGSGVTAIGAKAFNYCNALQTVKCIGTVPPVMASTDCFSTAAYNRATLLVPRNSEATYAAADYWYKFAHIDGWGSAGRGDVNGDGVMNIADVTFLIDVLLTGDSEGLYFESADLNINGRLDIGDVTSLIDDLLNGN